MEVNIKYTHILRGTHTFTHTQTHMNVCVFYVQAKKPWNHKCVHVKIKHHKENFGKASGTQCFEGS